ncbi:MAG TPA: hypothetical protein VNH14_14520 [Gemmatimonadales bacterium]|nr:hypothetical protein [Gemmatimonadales bacterium]
MATLHNALKHFPSLQIGIGRALGIDHEQQGVARVSETLQPIHDPWARDEFSWLRDEQLWNFETTQAAVAAAFGFVGVRNIAASGLLLTLSGFEVFSAVSPGYQLRAGPQSATDVASGPNSSFGRDFRQINAFGGIPAFSIAGSSAALNVLNGPFWGGSAPSGNTITEATREWIIPPGFEMRLYGTTVNQAFTVNMWGRVRKAITQEGV